MDWPLINNSLFINSLYYNCIKQLINYYQIKFKKSSTLNVIEKKLNFFFFNTNLPINVKQEIIDFCITQKIQIDTEFICLLMDNGGFLNFDLWTLCQINNLNKDEITIIFKKLKSNCLNLIQLSVGGSNWIYDSNFIEKLFNNFFEKDFLPKLQKLKIQQIKDNNQLILILNSCPNLTHLEINQSFLTDLDLQIIFQKLHSTKNFELRNLSLPFTVKKHGLLTCFNLFPSIESFSCSNFEPILDYLDNACVENVFLKNKINNLINLKVTRPMGLNSVIQIACYCSNLNELNLEIQETMQLKPIQKLKNLKKLSISNSSTFPTSYTNQILPILEEIGKQLEYLSLDRFNVLDLVEIGKSCPNLHTFSAKWFEILGISGSTISILSDRLNFLTLPHSSLIRSSINLIKSKRNNKQFSNLKSLRLIPNHNKKLPNFVVEFLLKNTQSLEYLELHNCKELNTEQFRHWIDLGDDFKQMKCMIIKNSNYLDKKIIDKLFHTAQNLKHFEYDQPFLNTIKD